MYAYFIPILLTTGEFMGGQMACNAAGSSKVLTLGRKAHPTAYTLHPTPCTLQTSHCTLHPTPYTLRPILYTFHLTTYTLQPKTETEALAALD